MSERAHTITMFLTPREIKRAVLSTRDPPLTGAVWSTRDPPLRGDRHLCPNLRGCQLINHDKINHDKINHGMMNHGMMNYGTENVRLSASFGGLEKPADNRTRR